MSLIGPLQSWQPLLGSTIGFAGLITAALWNFRLNRRRDKRLRDEEVISTATALYGEILLLRAEAARIARTVANIHIAQGHRANPTIKFDRHFLEGNPLPDATLYEALAPKIGMLPPRLILAITGFHANYLDLKRSLPLLLDDPDRGYSYSVTSVLGPARDAVLDVVPALREIEQMAQIEVPFSDPGLGKTLDVIDWETDMGQG